METIWLNGYNDSLINIELVYILKKASEILGILQTCFLLFIGNCITIW